MFVHFCIIVKVEELQIIEIFSCAYYLCAQSACNQVLFYRVGQWH